MANKKITEKKQIFNSKEEIEELKRKSKELVELAKKLGLLEKIKVRVSVEDTQKKDIIPIPKEYWEKREILFPHKFTKRAKPNIQDLKGTDKRSVILRRETADKIITYMAYIPKEIPTDDLPKFGELTDNIYKACILFQKTLNDNFLYSPWVNVTMADILRTVGYTKEEIDRKGKIYYLANKSIQTLAYFVYEIKDKVTSKIVKIGHILDYETDPKKEGFSFSLNREHALFLLKMIEGKSIKYVPYPRLLLKDARKIEPHKLRIFEYLLELKGLPKVYPIKLRQILLKIAQYKRKEIIKKIEDKTFGKFLGDIWTEAQNKGILKDYKYIDTSSENPLDWKIKLYVPGKKEYFPINEKLAIEIVSWLTGPLFEKRAKKDKNLKYIINSMKKYGAPRIGEIYLNIKTKGQNPGIFWEEIKKLKEGDT